MGNQKSSEVAKALRQFHVCAPMLFALVDEVRQHIVMEIAEAGDGGLCVTDITSRSRLSRPAISHHLKVLKDCGLIKARKEGTQVYYSLYLKEEIEHLTGLIGAIEVLIDKAKETARSNRKKTQAGRT
ncbi:MAG: metalloregulator ArsR/SmtB family transcription factor [Sphaerochaetaceae bacterium]